MAAGEIGDGVGEGRNVGARVCMYHERGQVPEGIDILWGGEGGGTIVVGNGGGESQGAGIPPFDFLATCPPASGCTAAAVVGLCLRQPSNN